MIATQMTAINTLRARMTTFFLVVGTVVGVFATLLGTILIFLRDDTAAIRADISMHLGQHISGDFRPSKDARMKGDAIP